MVRNKCSTHHEHGTPPGRRIRRPGRLLHRDEPDSLVSKLRPSEPINNMNPKRTLEHHALLIPNVSVSLNDYPILIRRNVIRVSGKAVE